MSSSNGAIASMFGGSSSSAKGKGPAVEEPAAYELPWRVLPRPVRCAVLTDNAARSQGREGTRDHRYSSGARLPADIRLQHRPRTLDDIVGNSETIERLKVIAKDGNCPHIIISVRAVRVM